MKMAFIADIHSNVHAFKAVLEKISELDIEDIYCCGDIVGYNAFPSECVDLIRKHNIKSVLGNHDLGTVEEKFSWFKDDAVKGIMFSRSRIDEDQLNFLKKLPYELSFTCDGNSFYMTHASPRDNLFEYIPAWTNDKVLKIISKDVDADYIIIGHTHVQMQAEINYKTFLNPGSVGQPRDGISKACFMVFDTDYSKPVWYRLKYDIEAERKAIKSNKLPDNLGQRLIIGK